MSTRPIIPTTRLSISYAIISVTSLPLRFGGRPPCCRNDMKPEQPPIRLSQCHLHHCTYTATYQKFRFTLHFRHLPQAPQPLHLPQMQQVSQIGHRFNQAHITHHAYQPTTLSKLTITTKSLQSFHRILTKQSASVCGVWIVHPSDVD